ncbi:ribonuclease III [Ampullimonas aquatilis]|uniref:ribonuclease III n=1 Tax=Ampullimonas aquatilis TaxID=1341549 RepID=UPI003C7223ED
MSLAVLQQKLGYVFARPALLQQALTHRSYSSTHNERLEFLGDSVLNCAMASLLYARFAAIDEGDLSRVRANLVKQQALHEIAQRLELSQFILLGDGEMKSGGARRPSILADAVEGILGAIFLDGGFDQAQRVIQHLYAAVLARPDLDSLGKDAKTQLQEYLQGKKIALPAYQIVATHGAAHSQEFEVQCDVPSLGLMVSGRGASRRAAEQAAATLALQQIAALPVAKSARKPRVAGMTPLKKTGGKSKPVVADKNSMMVGTGSDAAAELVDPKGESPKEVS